MTKDEILNMPAGREMDVTIGYRVMDLVAPPEIYPNYSTDISDAWKVTEKLRIDGWGMVIANKYFYSPSRSPGYGVDLRKEGKYAIGYAETAPLAICRAALLSTIEDE